MPLKLYRLKAVVFTLGLENKAGDMMPQLSKDYYEIINVIEDFKSCKEE